MIVLSSDELQGQRSWPEEEGSRVTWSQTSESGPIFDSVLWFKTFDFFPPWCCQTVCLCVCVCVGGYLTRISVPTYNCGNDVKQGYRERQVCTNVLKKISYCGLVFVWNIQQTHRLGSPILDSVWLRLSEDTVLSDVPCKWMSRNHRETTPLQTAELHSESSNF